MKNRNSYVLTIIKYFYIGNPNILIISYRNVMSTVKIARYMVP